MRLKRGRLRRADKFVARFVIIRSVWYVGSVVRVIKTCSKRLSGTWNISSVEMRPKSPACLPSFGKYYTFWCVSGLFQIGPTVVPYEALEGKTAEGGQICRVFRDDSFGMVRRQCGKSEREVFEKTKRYLLNT